MQEKKFIKITLDKNTGDDPLSSTDKCYGDYRPIPELFYQVRVCCKGKHHQPVEGSEFIKNEVVIFPDIKSPLFRTIELCKNWLEENGYKIGDTVTRFREEAFIIYEITAEITHIGYEIVLGTKDDNRESYELECFDYKKGHVISEKKDEVISSFTNIANLEERPFRITLSDSSETFVKTFITRSFSAAMESFWHLVKVNNKFNEIHDVKIKEITEYQGDELVIV